MKLNRWEKKIVNLTLEAFKDDHLMREHVTGHQIYNAVYAMRCLVESLHFTRVDDNAGEIENKVIESLEKKGVRISY